MQPRNILSAWIGLAMGLLWEMPLLGLAGAGVKREIRLDRGAATNPIMFSWPANPSSAYQVQAAAKLDAAWEVMTPAPLVATSNIRGRLDKALQQPRAQPVAALEIPGHALVGQPPHLRSQIGAVDLGPDQKPVPTQNPLQILLALRPVPPDPLVARRQVERGAVVAQVSQPAMVRGDEIAQSPPHQAAVAQGMLAQHEFVPRGPGAQRPPPPPDTAPGAARHPPAPPRAGAPAGPAAWVAPDLAGAAGLGQDPVTLRLQITQGHHNRRDLSVAFEVAQVQAAA